MEVAVAVLVPVVSFIVFGGLILKVLGGNPFFFLQKRIYLQDVWGEIYKSRKGKVNTYVYPVTQIGHIVLHEDGSVSGASSYIKKWSYNKEELV